MAPQTVDMLGGFKIPIIGLGTYTAVDEKELENALNVALETGYRHIDTANLYNNEHVIGRVLKSWFESGKLKREDVFITTKLPGYGVHPDRVERYIKRSLEQLQLDYIDLYLIHFPICLKELPQGSKFSGWEPEPTDLIGTWKILEKQVDLGRTKTIGISNFNKEQVGRILANSRIKPASNQIELHVHMQQPELIKYCQDNGIVVVSFSSMSNPGVNKYLASQGVGPRIGAGSVLLDPVVKQIADKHKKNPSHVLLKFWVQKNVPVIPKSVTPTRIRDNFNLFDFTLDSDDMKTLEGLDKGPSGRLNKMDFSPANNPRIINETGAPRPIGPFDVPVDRFLHLMSDVLPNCYIG